MLAVRDVTVAHGPITALRGVSLTAAEGEVVAVIGANGAGKSTLLRTIAGFHRPEDGDVTFAGQAVAGRAPERIRALGVGLVPEGRQMWPALTVDDHLRLGLYTRRRERADHQHRIEDMYDLFPELAGRRRQRAGSLSGGEQQMVAIARALVASPRLVLLDEPTLGLAPVVVDRIGETLHSLRHGGTAMLLVEQNAGFALSHADRAYVLELGQVTMEGPTAELARREDLIDAYLGVSLPGTDAG